MPRKYIPKPIKVKNVKHFEKLEINPEDLSRSQANYVDRLITLLKPVNKRSDLRDEFADFIYEFVELTNNKDSDFIRNAYRSITIQLNGKERPQDPKHYIIELSGELSAYFDGSNN